MGFLPMWTEFANYYGHRVSRASLRRGDLVIFAGHIGTVWGHDDEGNVIVGGADAGYGTYYGTIEQWSGSANAPYHTNPEALRFYRLDPSVAPIKCPPNIPKNITHLLRP